MIEQKNYDNIKTLTIKLKIYSTKFIGSHYIYDEVLTSHNQEFSKKGQLQFADEEDCDRLMRISEEQKLNLQTL